LLSQSNIYCKLKYEMESNVVWKNIKKKKNWIGKGIHMDDLLKPFLINTNNVSIIYNTLNARNNDFPIAIWYSKTNKRKHRIVK